jgi:catechol 2,3-dioxygenase-like lactoylglutathione lyase family enzyme
MPAIEIEGLDHLVLTVADIDRACGFYERVLGMRRETFGAGRVALHFGRQKINLHPDPTPHLLVATQPAPGTADLCFLTASPLSEMAAHLEACGVEILAGPLARSGADGPIRSLYCRDPDGNLIELANRQPAKVEQG